MERLLKRGSVFHVQRTCVSLKVAGTSVVFLLQRICIYRIYYLFPRFVEVKCVMAEVA